VPTPKTLWPASPLLPLQPCTALRRPLRITQNHHRPSTSVSGTLTCLPPLFLPVQPRMDYGPWPSPQLAPACVWVSAWRMPSPRRLMPMSTIGVCPDSGLRRSRGSQGCSVSLSAKNVIVGGRTRQMVADGGSGLEESLHCRLSTVGCRLSRTSTLRRRSDGE
jgi:hypothetical protein